ncbi:uncharacterized protein [Nicotiana tomentosiformis]|uniref:uncharacterized protein n=1 Tax=Nicotiana tomentosiformis TaxID=4098 RepID=UPI00388C404D
MLKDYNITILDHVGNANVDVDALSTKAESMRSLAFIPAVERPLAMDHIDAKEVTISDDGVLRLQVQVCVPNVDGLRDLILEKAHNLQYFIRQGVTKMYHDLKQHY